MTLPAKYDGFPLDTLRHHRRELCEALAESDAGPTDDVLQRIAHAHMAVLAMEAVIDENTQFPDRKRELLTPEDRRRKAEAEAADKARDVYITIANNQIP